MHATLDDLVALAQAVLDGPLSDSAALEPIAVGGQPMPSTSATSGGCSTTRRAPSRATPASTGGFSSALLIDRDAGIAAIVLANAHRDVDSYAQRYLIEAATAD